METPEHRPPTDDDRIGSTARRRRRPPAWRDRCVPQFWRDEFEVVRRDQGIPSAGVDNAQMRVEKSLVARVALPERAGDQGQGHAETSS